VDCFLPREPRRQFSRGFEPLRDHPDNDKAITHRRKKTANSTYFGGLSRLPLRIGHHMGEDATAILKFTDAFEEFLAWERRNFVALIDDIKIRLDHRKRLLDVVELGKDLGREVESMREELRWRWRRWHDWDVEQERLRAE
jgi:hypothetical protein